MAIPMSQWSRDHWMIFFYVAQRVISGDGTPQRDHMRCDSRRHSHLRPVVRWSRGLLSTHTTAW